MRIAKRDKKGRFTSFDIADSDTVLLGKDCSNLLEVWHGGHLVAVIDERGEARIEDRDKTIAILSAI